MPIAVYLYDMDENAVSREMSIVDELALYLRTFLHHLTFAPLYAHHF